MIQKCSSWKVFIQFLNNPTKKFHIREISRNINLATTSVKKHVNFLINENLVMEKKDDVFKYYISNFDNDKFRFYKKIHTLISIRESGIIDFLESNVSPDTMILFGSAGKGEDTMESDIDIFIQAKEKKVEIKKYEKKLNKKIQLFWAENISKIPKELRNNIVNGIKLEGYFNLWN